MPGVRYKLWSNRIQLPRWAFAACEMRHPTNSTNLNYGLWSRRRLTIFIFVIIGFSVIIPILSFILFSVFFGRPKPPYKMCIIASLLYCSCTACTWAQLFYFQPTSSSYFKFFTHSPLLIPWISFTFKKCYGFIPLAIAIIRMESKNENHLRFVNKLVDVE